MASLIIHVTRRLPWWAPALIRSASVGVRMAKVIGLPVAPKHIDALGQRMIGIILRHTRITVRS